MAGECYKLSVNAAVHTVRQLTKNDDFWIKSEEGRDVLVPHKYQQAFRSRINNSCTTQASRASALVQMDDEDLSLMLAVDEWSYRFPNIVSKEELIRVLSPGSSDENPHGTLRMVYKEMQATSPMVANRKFTVLRTCLQIDQGTWVIAEVSHVSAPNTYRRLPSGCLIERITETVSKVTWVEHMEVDKPLPNRSGFAFAAERMVAWLERSCERWSDMNATCHIKDAEGKKVPWILEKLSLMELGESMARGLFENVGPNQYFNSILWRSSEDMKVYASLYKSSASFEVAGGVVTFRVRHSPELVLVTLGDEQTHHEWDMLGGLAKLYPLKKYSTGGDTRNNISASMIDGSSSEILIKEVDVNRSGSLVLWSTVSMKDFDLMSHGRGSPEDTVLISGFSITPDGHTPLGELATNYRKNAQLTKSYREVGGSNPAPNLVQPVSLRYFTGLSPLLGGGHRYQKVHGRKWYPPINHITLVLRKLVEGNQPLQEKRQQSIESIIFAINQTVGRVKEALERHQ